VRILTEAVWPSNRRASVPVLILLSSCKGWETWGLLQVGSCGYNRCHNLTLGSPVESEPARIHGAVRLGDDFEFEPNFLRLRRGGHVLKLQRIPLEALATLVEHKGEIVSRDQLTERIWGKNAFLDADNSLNIAIRKLRLALEDDPEQPNFIQTVTGKGYCLIAPVVEIDVSPEPAPTKPGSLPLEAAIGAPKSPRWQALIGAAALLLVVGGWFLWTRYRHSPEPAKQKLMLAVLPFQNLTGDAAQDYFSDGLTEEMVTQVGNLDPQHLGVIARTSAMYYKNHPQPLQQVGHDLGVQYVLEGSVRRDDEQARISVRLVRVADGSTLWTDSFDRHVGDALTLQSEIAQRVGTALQVQVLGRVRPKTVDSKVVEAYLRGRFELNRAGAPDEARAYFERTIALDSSYAPAYAGLADFYWFRAVRDDEGSEQAWRLAEKYAMQALSLDAESEEAHIAIARVKLMHDWDWSAAREHALCALQLNPSSPEAHSLYALYLRIAGNIPQDLNHRKQALAMDPYRADLKQQLAVEHYFARDYQPIVDWARESLASNPNNPEAQANLCVNLGRLGHFDESVTECVKTLAFEGHAEWATAYQQEYRQRGYEAANLLVARKQLDETLKRPNPDLWQLANDYISAGMPEETLRTLFRGLPTHEPGLLQIRVDPDFDPIRNDSRYADLIRQIGFPKE
jgi:TolB-like protein/DNA-binding winged helix-turn-helix (wHTH) protein